MSRRTKKKKIRINWDTLFKAVGAIVTVATLVFAVYQYKARTNLERDLQKSQVYTQLVITTAEFSTASEKTEAEKAKQNFKKLYYGELSTVVDQNVKDAVDKFARAINEWESQNAPPSDYIPPSKFRYSETLDGPLLTFGLLSLEISKSIKESKK